MPEQPPLDDATICACVQTAYGITLTGLEFLPLGYDSLAGVYRAQASDHSYFLKVTRRAVNELSIRLPRYLHDQGIAPVVAPLPTVNGQLWGRIDPFTLILYPFIEGTSPWDTGLSDEQWATLGAALKQIHAMPLPPDLRDRMPVEMFVPHQKWMAVIRQLHAAVRTQTYADPHRQQLAAFWRAHYDTIGTVIEWTEQLGERLRGTSPELAVCHADIHLANLLIDAQGALFIVDWDEPIRAPVERDLMFVTVGGFVTEARAENAFFRGYGPAALDPVIMAYYRYERAMQDLADFAAQVFLAESSSATKADSVYWFQAQFAPDGLIAAAHALAHVIP